jgi:ribokinase
MTPDLLILGQITIDHVVPAEPARWYERLGGNALYAAAGARLWCDASRIGVVARRGPNMPAALDAALAASGLTDSGIVPVTTDNMVEWLIYEADGSRRNLPRAAELRDTTVDEATRGARYIQRKYAVSASHEDIPPTWLPAAGIHLGPQVGDRHPMSIGALRNRAHLLSVDPSPTYSRSLSERDLGEMLRGADVLMPSEGEISHMALDRDWAALARRLLASGFPEIVLKLGRHGAMLCDRAGATHAVPAVPARPVDLTGAGDAFCGAFLACRVVGHDMVQAARRAATAAAMVIECAGVDAALALRPADAAARFKAAFPDAT